MNIIIMLHCFRFRGVTTIWRVFYVAPVIQIVVVQFVVKYKIMQNKLTNIANISTHVHKYCIELHPVRIGAYL